MFDLSGIFDNWSTQAIILLSIVALGLIIAGVVTQGFARTIVTVIGVFILIALILILKNAEDVGRWIKDKVFKLGMVNPEEVKGLILNGIQLFTRI
ncbi:hypothetical protein [Enterococcus gilvus]|uniref:Uncharacterized protein n=1 Tax=Enterococcus gilvus ATCC BAA-350 TaxID=1158614 RepID=R2V5T5_9ENTE|nr:hypothetical protein [Enterococcus gilvus]EOI53105.1 hypothetical protein UKC_04013 [Enterococcus gilvus ATCC BAA-350]EOW78424.1 hypothetical protein I592_04017 [Enterococcus gilvus ATCC BAA-350]OJG40433.1 hypothetical protein RV02_GL002382 [Enterococcus gilvus]